MLSNRFRTWLFVASVLAAVLGPVLVGAGNGLLDAQYQANSPIQLQPTPAPSGQNDPSQADCIPVVDQGTYAVLDALAVSQEADLNVSLRMAALFAADQAARRLPGLFDPQKIDEGDANRRLEVLGYIQDGRIRTARDLVYAAYIFQHGDCPEHYRLANRLAQIAMDTRYSEARWIYAATLDRYLVSLGELQKYGTQYTWVDGEFRLYPVDPTTTDAERAKYNVPPLSEAMIPKPAGTGGGVVQRRWLESWWLTLTGAGFAALSAIIGLVDAKMNARYGQIVLAMALATYLVSVIGHYAQIDALRQGTAGLQADIWRLVIGMVILVWLACALVEIYRVVKGKTAQPLPES